MSKKQVRLLERACDFLELAAKTLLVIVLGLSVFALFKMHEHASRQYKKLIEINDAQVERNGYLSEIVEILENWDEEIVLELEEVE